MVPSGWNDEDGVSATKETTRHNKGHRELPMQIHDARLLSAVFTLLDWLWFESGALGFEARTYLHSLKQSWKWMTWSRKEDHEILYKQGGNSTSMQTWEGSVTFQAVRRATGIQRKLSSFGVEFE